MARPGTVVSSLPVTDDDDPNLTPDDQYDELNEEDFDDPAEAAAVSEGYASLAEKETMEAQAHGQGWRPLSEYRGTPGKWKTAKKFLEDGQNYLPFVQKENRELKQTMAGMTTEMEGLRTEMATTRADMNKLLAYSRNANQAGYERAVKDLKAQQRQAVAEGDTAKFDQIEGQLGEMADARAEATDDPAPEPAPAARPQPKAQVSLPQEYQDFISENSWFNSDRVLNSAMIAEHNAIIEESPGMSLADQLEKAKEAVVARFPKKFGVAEDAPAPPAPRERRPAAPLPPAGGNRQRPQRPADDPIEAIADPRDRADARQGYASARKSVPNLTKAEYMEIWNDPHGDVLDVLRRNKPTK